MSRRPGKKGNGGGGVDVDVRPQEDGGGRGIEVAAPAVTMRDGKAARSEERRVGKECSW